MGMAGGGGGGGGGWVRVYNFLEVFGVLCLAFFCRV